LLKNTPKDHYIVLMKGVWLYFFEANFLPDSRLVVKTFTGLVVFTLLANFNTKWLRRLPVLLCVVRFFGFPIIKNPFMPN